MASNKKADMGIGTLIIFIAMLVVAGITANVLIQTTQSLQSSALLTGRQAQRAISTFPEINRIIGVDVNNAIQDIRVEMKLSPGSEGIDLSNAMLSLETNNFGYNYIYSDGDCINDSITGYTTDSLNMNGTFTIRYLVRGNSYQNGYLQRGDIIELCFASGETIDHNNRMEVRFIPQIGMTATSSFYSPNIITGTRVRLFP